VSDFVLFQTKVVIRTSTRRRSRKEIIKEANRKLTFVPLVFIVCRIWGTARFMIGNFGHGIVNESYVTWINPLQVKLDTCLLVVTVLWSPLIVSLC